MYNFVQYSDEQPNQAQVMKTILLIFLLTIVIVFEKNKANRKWWNKKCCNNATIKISVILGETLQCHYLNAKLIL